MPQPMSPSSRRQPTCSSPSRVRARGAPSSVQPGDTLWDLALANRTTPAAIVAKNRFGGGAMIHPGQRLLVPGAKAETDGTTSSPARAAACPASGRVHVVRAGDTMTGIAARYGVALTKLLAANRLANPG